MARLTWNQAGSRLFEAGVEMGVLYPVVGAGVAWNGLISVSDKPSGGSPTPYYVDGIKYLNVPSMEEFEGSLEAYTYPDAFEASDGISSHSSGLKLGQQMRKPFGLSYRTSIGNDLEGPTHGFKIHLLYNLLANPTSRSYSSLSDQTDPSTFSWDLTSTPVEIPGYKPSSHFILDSRKVNVYERTLVERILYGTSSTSPRLPNFTEIVALLESSTLIYPANDLDPANLLYPR